MTISFTTQRHLSKRLRSKLEKLIGFEITLDADDDGCCEYFAGYDSENVGEEGCCEEDPLPYDDAVRVCGILAHHGINEAYIDGNGGWAMGMIRGTDFRGYATTDEHKKEWQRVASIYWREADPRKLAEMLPKWEGGA